MYTRNKRNRRNCMCSDCRDCRELPVMPKDPMLANSYVPYQYVDAENDTFCPMESLAHGTAFPELATSYMPGESQCIIRYLEGTETCEEVCDDDGR